MFDFPCYFNFDDIRDIRCFPGGGLGTHLWLANATGGASVGHPGVPSLRLVHHWEAIDSDASGDRDIRVQQFLVKAAPRLGVWHDFVMNVRWTENNDGFLKLWHQEDDSGYALVADRSGPTVWKNQPADQGPFFSAGPYSGGSGTAKTVYSDEYRLGDSSSGFEFAQIRGGAPLIGNYGDWVESYLSAYSGEHEGDDDPGDFGVANFKRYAFALDPLHPSEPTLSDEVIMRKEGRFAFSFHRYSGIDDVIHIVESAPNVTGSWDTRRANFFVSDTIRGESGCEEVRMTGHPAKADSQFFRVRASTRKVPDGTVFYEDFETYADGASPSGRWLTSAPQDTAALVQGAIGERYLTMTDVNQDEVTRVIRPFNAEGAENVSVTFDWRRKTDHRYRNHLDEGLAHVPALYLLQDAAHTDFHASNIVAHMRFRSWDRGIWLVRDASDSFDSGTVDAGDFLHDEPLLVRMTYRRSGDSA